ncbi:HIT family protein [Streptomyces sp. NPDC001070]
MGEGSMTDEVTASDCFVCRKHCDDSLMPGGAVWMDDLVVVSHLSPRAPGGARSVYLGHLLVEPRRHAGGLGDLSDAEAQRVGLWCARAAGALREAGGAEHVYAAVIGDNVPHLHVHLLPRYPGTPRDYWWQRVDEWPDAPRGGEAEAAAMVERLRVRHSNEVPRAL